MTGREFLGLLGERGPAIVVPASGGSADELADATADWPTEGFDVIEWRADLSAHPITPTEVAAALARRAEWDHGHAVLFTVRTDAEGGRFPADGPYADAVRAAAAAGADAVDVEVERAGATDLIAEARSLGTAVIGSHHDFESTPPVLEMVGLLAAAFDAGADVAKLAVMPRTPGDVAALLQATWQATTLRRGPVITMAMGTLGLVTRTSGHVFGSVATFATLGAASAPGQLPLARLCGLLTPGN